MNTKVKIVFKIKKLRVGVEKKKRAKERVIVYIDGFNLYFGMKEAGFTDLKWLDVMKLARSCLKPGQVLQEVKYFTSTITRDPVKAEKQKTYLDALAAKGAIIIRGKYQTKKVRCEKCAHFWLRTNEKMTDVNIATSLIMDTVTNRCDVAILISGDSDLIPAILSVNKHLPPKKVTVIFPPFRHNRSVALAAKGSYELGRKRLKDCQMEDTVISTNGFALEKPEAWKR